MARRKKGGQKLMDIGKPKKPKIKVDLTPHYRPKPPSRGKRTEGPAISSPDRPSTEITTGPSLWGPPDQEGRIKPQPKPSKGGKKPAPKKPPKTLMRGYPSTSKDLDNAVSAPRKIQRSSRNWNK